ncbi:hypothetical protein [Shimazuella kribbensis]|uniref:hypothetical protein n=1 Tax=Shimazuella kribbensis TaxID=139808 RepID=UPI000400B6C9|nr:hypothetical protein [Shimazuella kribbensis]
MSKRQDVHHNIAGFSGAVNTGEDEAKVVNAIIEHGGEVTAIGTSKIPVRDEDLNQQ